MLFCSICNLYFKYIFTSEQVSQNVKVKCLLCTLNHMIRIYSDDSVKFDINSSQILKEPLICNYNNNSYDVVYYVY